MSKLMNIKKAPFEIAQILGGNELIQRLLVIDTPNALTKSFTPLSINELLANKYINITPRLENGKIDSGRNTFIEVRINECDFAREGAVGEVLIGTDTEHALLENNKIRLLELADAIEGILNERKISTAGKILCRFVQEIEYSEFTYGYTIAFSISDQQTQKGDV